jgi:nitrate reductase NapAB chaperone NapD
MHLSGLVLLFAQDDEPVQQAFTMMKGAGHFILGERIGSRLSLVMEVDSAEDALKWYHWLQELPGVVSVDIAYVTVMDDHVNVVGQEA